MRAVNLLPPDLRGAPEGLRRRAPPPGGRERRRRCVRRARRARPVRRRPRRLRAGRQHRQGPQGRARRGVQHARARVRAQAAELKPYADFEALANARVQTVQRLASSRFDWEQALRDLSRALPADVTLQLAQGRPRPAGAGGGGSALRSAITAPAIKLTGCTPPDRSRHADVPPAQRPRRHPRHALASPSRRLAAGAPAASAGTAQRRTLLRQGLAPRVRARHVLRGRAAGRPSRPATATDRRRDGRVAAATPTPDAGGATATPATTTPRRPPRPREGRPVSRTNRS